MLCEVYVLYQSNLPRPDAEVKAHPVRGWLCYGDAGRSYPHNEAHLYRSRIDATELLPFVDYALVKKIKRGGLRIEGLQEHGYREHWKQVWWCIPVAVPDEPDQRMEGADGTAESSPPIVAQLAADALPAPSR